jgi:hypothetical protein
VRVCLSGVARAEALGESGGTQRSRGTFLATSCAGAVERHVDDREAAHSFLFLRSANQEVAA